MRTLFFAALAALGLNATPQAEAGDFPIVVELYTSQGCSSCPPADELLHKLAKRDDVIALALHVDYWDYIGWKDQFARPEHTARQRALTRVAGGRTIYTPQMVISGRDHVIGARPMDVMDLVARHKSAADTINIVAVPNGDQINVTLTPMGSNQKNMWVQLVRYAPERTVAIKRGENAGRTLSYANIVTDWQLVEEWNGAKARDISVTASGADKAVLIVQRAGYGPIVAAQVIR